MLLYTCRLDQDGSVKVGDFGMARDVYATGYFRQGNRITVKLPYRWMAIESMINDTFTEKTDVVRALITLHVHTQKV